MRPGISIILSPADRRRLEALVGDRNVAQKHVWRARIVLHRADGIGTNGTKPYTPKTNGKAERFIQSSLREWAYARAYQNSHHRARELPKWLHHYNWHRPHAGIKGLQPISRSGLDVNNLMRLHN